MGALTWLLLFLFSLNLLLASLAFSHTILASHGLVGCCHILLLVRHFLSWALAFHVVRLAFIMNHDRLFQREGEGRGRVRVIIKDKAASSVMSRNNIDSIMGDHQPLNILSRYQTYRFFFSGVHRCR